MRLDQAIAKRFGLSRRAAQEAVRQGRVDVEGKACREPGREVEDGANLVFDPNRPRSSTPARRLDILYEDAQIVIVNKPAGLLSQPTPAREPHTLVEQVGRYLVRKHGIKKPYVGIVHRLDQDTSGAILVVTAARALRPFQAIFRAHAIERSYLAVVEGVFATPSGRIDLPLVADRGDGRRGVARRADEGAAAVTHYEVLERFGHLASLVACRLQTGRTHQIRIHLAELGHPVIGDRVYRPRRGPAFPITFQRQALHAQALGFVHPISRQELHVDAALAADMAGLISELRDRYGTF
jgi:23S rRNA pseudouridine1911/1915/1917 synthase